MRVLNLGCGHKVSGHMINVDFVSDDDRVIRHNLLKKLPFETDSIDMVYHANVLEHFSEDEGRYFLNENFRVLKPGGILRCIVPDLENVVIEYLERLANAKASGIDNRYRWIKLELLDQLVRERPGGKMAEFLASDHNVDTYVASRIGAIKGLDSYRTANKRLTLRRLSRVLRLKLSGLLGRNFQLGMFCNSGERHKWMYDEVSLSYALSQAGFNEIKRQSSSESYLQEWQRINIDIDHKGNSIDPSAIVIEGKKYDKNQQNV